MEAFVRAVELGSLTAAARSLGTTQPTISKLVVALESSLGVRLLERGPSRVSPTAEGVRFLESARRLLEDYEEAIVALDQGIREPSGLVRISAPVALGELHLNALMLEALKRYPQLQIDLMLDDRFVDPVEGRFDISVRIGTPLPPDLVARQLAVWPRYLVASGEYVREHGCPKRLQDLSQHEFLRYPLWADDSVPLTGPGGPSDVAVTSRYRINSAVALLDAVTSGAGIAFMPCWMAKELLESGRLVRLLPRWSGPPQTAYLLYARRRTQPTRVRVLLDLLDKGIKSL